MLPYFLVVARCNVSVSNETHAWEFWKLLDPKNFEAFKVAA